MKILNRLKMDAKAMIQDLKETNETLLNTLTDYQDIIFEQREKIDCQKAEIERLKAELQMADGYADALIERTKSEAIKEFAEELVDEKFSNYDKTDDILVYDIQGRIYEFAESYINRTVGESTSEQIKERF